MFSEAANTMPCSEIKSFPPDAHWFCPRRHKDDYIDYDNPDEAEEDMSPETKQELIQDAKRRYEVAYKYTVVLGLTPELSKDMLEDYTELLHGQLANCDKCIHNWHIGRKPHIKELQE